MTFLDIIRAFLGLGREAPVAPVAPPAPQPDPWPAPGVYTPGQVSGGETGILASEQNQLLTPVARDFRATEIPDLPPLPDLVIPVLPPPVPPAAIVLLHHYEGCRLVAYTDAAGIATIGWGNTRRLDGSRVQITDRRITQAEADALFAFWLADFDKGVRSFLPPGCPEAPHAAMLCFAYNVGLSAAKGSTAAKRLTAGDLVGAGQAPTLWNKADGKVLKGLRRRREAERLVMLGATPYSAIAAAEKAFP